MLWIRNDFFGSVSVSGSYFSVGFRSDPVSVLIGIFNNILNINFTFVFPSGKCVRLHIMTRYKIYRDFCFDQKEFMFFRSGAART